MPRELLAVCILIGSCSGGWARQPESDASEELFEQDLQFVNSGDLADGGREVIGIKGIGVVTTVAAADEIAQRFGEHFPIGTRSRLAVSPEGLSKIVVNVANKKAPSRFSQKDNLFVVFSGWQRATVVGSQFQIVGFESVVRKGRTLTIKCLCRLTPFPKGSELGTPVFSVAAMITPSSTKDWPTGDYECRLEFCPIDDLYLKRYAPELRPLNEASRIRDPIAVKFELTD